jgi:hypothetical protein
VVLQWGVVAIVIAVMSNNYGVVSLVSFTYEDVTVFGCICGVVAVISCNHGIVPVMRFTCEGVAVRAVAILLLQSCCNCLVVQQARPLWIYYSVCLESVEF